MTNRHSSDTDPMRDDLQTMLREYQAKHHLTLAFHQQINMEAATKKIQHWHRHMSRRLFGRNFRDLPPDQRIEFLLLPEGGHANLHFHGVIRLPETHKRYFERIALSRWRHVAFKGTLHFGPFDPIKGGPEGWYSYITKGHLCNQVLDSSMD